MNNENKDWTTVAALEQAIERKFGKKAIENPKKNWTEEKEQDYQEQKREMKKLQTNIKNKEEWQSICEGALVSEKLIIKQGASSCSRCGGSYFGDARDDFYRKKYNMCFKCYIKFEADR